MLSEKSVCTACYIYWLIHFKNNTCDNKSFNMQHFTPFCVITIIQRKLPWGNGKALGSHFKKSVKNQLSIYFKF